jgi:CheY-like chemotaxis protein
MVYGFVKQSGGHISIYSEPNRGTSVKLYLPQYTGEEPAAATRAPEECPGAIDGEVVLVVEDNDQVRAFSVMALSDLGYKVLEERNAEEALPALAADQRIDLLFTDVMLPGETGRVLADRAVELRPGLGVLFTTGYSRNAIVHHGRLDRGVELLPKPFTFDQLAKRVREVLDKSVSRRAGAGS